jgi:general secretion pathway protein B
MSYILDALKKAERERDLRQVPTIMTVHEPGAIHRRRYWAVLGALVVCAGILIWLAMFALRTRPHPISAQSGAGENQSSNGTEAKRVGASIPVNSSSASPSSLQPAVTHKSEIASEKPIEMKIAPPTEVSGVPRNIFREKAVEDARRASPPVRTEAIMPPGEEEAAEDPPLPAEMIHIQRQLKLGGAGTPATGAKSDSKPDQTQPASLPEALGKMKMSLLYFSDNRAERTVFINGKKYGEGDHVEGTYLLESITLEGAILSYQGERAILRPISK